MPSSIFCFVIINFLSQFLLTRIERKQFRIAMQFLQNIKTEKIKKFWSGNANFPFAFVFLIQETKKCLQKNTKKCHTNALILAQLLDNVSSFFVSTVFVSLWKKEFLFWYFFSTWVFLYSRLCLDLICFGRNKLDRKLTNVWKEQNFVNKRLCFYVEWKVQFYQKFCLKCFI